MNVIFVLIQIALLRRDFNPVQLLQIPYVFVFSALIDVFVPYCELIPMDNYALQVLWSIVGCFMTAFGVFLQVKACFLTLPGEGINLAIARVTGIAFPKIKVAFDSTNVVVAAAVSLAASGGLYGVREGTILAALAVGSIVGLFNKLFPHFEKFCPIHGHITLTAATMNAPAEEEAPEQGKGTETPLVITISRQFGSGGREIGQALGKKLGIPVFDHSLIELTAKEAGLTQNYVRAHEQEVRRGVLYNLYMQSYQRIGVEPTQLDDLWLAQAHTITKLAEQGSCVIVGRCANAILKERPNTFNVFIHAPLVPRIGRVMERENIDHMKADAMIERIDAERAEHCKHFTGTTWGDANAYHLSLDSSFEPSEKNAEIIAQLAKAAFPSAPLKPNPKKSKRK